MVRNKKINPSSKLISNTIDQANGNHEITQLLYHKYRSIYSKVPTDDIEMAQIRDAIDKSLKRDRQVIITPAIIKQCILRLKSGKDDGDLGFKSDHLINGSHRLHVVLSLLFNVIELTVVYPSWLYSRCFIKINYRINSKRS